MQADGFEQTASNPAADAIAADAEKICGVVRADYGAAVDMEEAWDGLLKLLLFHWSL